MSICLTHQTTESMRVHNKTALSHALHCDILLKRLPLFDLHGHGFYQHCCSPMVPCDMFSATPNTAFFKHPWTLECECLLTPKRLDTCVC